MIETQKEAVTKTAKTVVDSTVAAGTKAVEASTGAATTAADKVKDILGKSKSLAETGMHKVTSVKVGDKNVGEYAKTTVDSVQSAVDVDQISGQVTKLREQIEGVLGSWKESFRPSTDTPKKAAATKTVAPKAPARKAKAPKAKAAKAAAPKAAKVNLSALTVDELRSMASDADIAGRSTMNKAQLVAALKKAGAPATK